MTITIEHDPWSVVAPRRLSASRAKDFMKCPLAWKLRTIDRLPDPPTLATVRGTLVHQVLEDLYGIPQPQRTLAAAVNAIPVAWQTCLADHRDYRAWLQVWDGQEEDLFRIAAELLAVYFTLESPERVLDCEQETDFNVTMAGVPAHGYIDRIDRAPDGAERLVDYKTGKRPLPAYEADALWQLLFYALARATQTGRAPAMVRLVYLGERRGILEYSPTTADLEGFAEQVAQLWARMHRAFDTAHFPATPSKLCGWCAYRALCPTQR